MVKTALCINIRIVVTALITGKLESHYKLGTLRIDGYSYTKYFLPCNESERDFLNIR